ncbi:MAG: T9SS type A sorting domain-containing protein [Bacteroidales bacterium]|nr:T9SS type A sorting domain-containing protein [Bacteroidales bacterium]
MKRILTTLTLLLTLCSFSFGQNSQNYYEYNSYMGGDMTVVAQVKIDGEIQGNNIELGAFNGNECRGAGRPNSKNIIYLQVYGNAEDDNGDIITFKIYDHNLKQELNLTSNHEVVTFVADKMVGSTKNPFIVYFESDYIAKIGDTKYTSLAEAVEAAQDEETVTLLKDAEGSGIVIDKDITIDFNGKTYTITEGNSIEVVEGGVLTVVETGGMNLAGQFIINGGQLYHNNDGVMATVKKTFTPQSYWNTISAPIVGGAAIPTNATHDLYRYDEVEHEWEYYLDADGIGFPTLELGRGYLYAAGKNDITVELNGELNVADVEFPLSYTEGNELKGFNLIGNPFTHNINENNFSASALSQGYYVISENGEWLSRYDGEETIEPMQSVLVQTTAANSSVKISKQVAATRSVSEGSLRINVNGNNCQDVAYVSFNEGIGLDKISHNNSTSAMLYITAEGKDYAVATMSKDVTEIPVSFKAMTMGEYTISVEAQNCEFETLYLKDMLTGASINLNTDSYTFMATSNDEANRFVLTTTEPTGIESNTLEAFVYINNSEIVINNIQGNAQVSIIDMMGRTVAKYNVFESAVISTSSLEKGVYIIQMTDANGIRTQKAIID